MSSGVNEGHRVYNRDNGGTSIPTRGMLMMGFAWQNSAPFVSLLERFELFVRLWSATFFYIFIGWKYLAHEALIVLFLLGGIACSVSHFGSLGTFSLSSQCQWRRVWHQYLERSSIALWPVIKIVGSGNWCLHTLTAQENRVTYLGNAKSDPNTNKITDQ